MKNLLAVTLLLGLGISISGCASTANLVISNRPVTPNFDATIVKIDDYNKLTDFPKKYTVYLVRNVTTETSSLDYDHIVILTVVGKSPLKVGQRVRIEVTDPPQVKIVPLELF